MSLVALFIIVLYTGCLIYAVVLQRFIQGLRELKNQERIVFQKFPSVSLVVAARNEAANLPITLQSLLAQEYPGEWEIIVVNDRSSDETMQILKQYASLNARLHIVTISEQTASPKKFALSRGIENSCGEVIVTTDADCVHQKSWLRELTSYMKEDTGVVAGLTLFNLPGEKIPLWQKIQMLDFFVTNVLAAGAIGKGIPACCNGSNLAYRRKVFNEVSGFKNQSNIVSGDDVLFLQQVSSFTNWKVAFAVHPATYVHSLPVNSFRNLIHQRLRWSSKGLHYSRSMSAFLFGIYLFFLLLVAIPLVMIAAPWSIFYLAPCIMWKLIWDFRIVSEGTKILNQCSQRNPRNPRNQRNQRNLRNLWSVYLPYFFSITLLAPFIGIGGLLLPYQWKGKWYYPIRLGEMQKRMVAAIKNAFMKPQGTVQE